MGNIFDFRAHKNANTMHILGVKKFIFSLAILTSLFPLVSACGVEEHRGEVLGNNLTGFGFFGGIIFTLIVMVFILGILLALKKNERRK